MTPEKEKELIEFVRTAFCATSAKILGIEARPALMIEFTAEDERGTFVLGFAIPKKEKA